MALAATTMQVLDDADTVKVLVNILKTNVSACSAIGAGFLVQISRIFMDLVGLYKAMSDLVAQGIASQGVVATRTPKIRGMRTIKKETLKLIDVYIARTDDPMAVTQKII